MKIKRVVCAISGGVDSAASAFLLKSRGYEVIGVFMKNWDLTDEKGQCTLAEDAEDAYNVCKKLSIPFKEVSFVKEYWNDVFLNFIKEYQTGWTPNPDVLCNKRIKFKAFFEHCQDKIGFDAVATGHYAKTSFGEELETFDASKGVRLLKSFDQLKDQTFFLSQIPQDALQFTMFPVGGMTKNIVKEIANSAGLSKISQKKESTGICFVGKRHFQDFIADYILPNPGPFVHIETKEVLAQHQGIHNWTIGQRCLIGGEKVRHFVAEKDPTTNSIFVAPGTDHPSLYRSTFFTDRPHWIHSWPRDLMETQMTTVKFRFQHTKPLIDAVLTLTGNNQLIVSLVQPTRALTPGQYAVFYKGEECLGSARIIKLGPSEYHMNYKSFITI
ncbi:mitochondrial tRNA-specific 2-thiouridylase 1-like isoform X2 [Artemia franciscana]|uniref:mitochondrial tRNA-specific 2-thiouridylase 1-like isoform X2 n=1 Tax=Artemia franciscana TaxID=6661 RepID=UPI0032DA1B20